MLYSLNEEIRLDCGTGKPKLRNTSVACSRILRLPTLISVRRVGENYIKEVLKFVPLRWMVRPTMYYDQWCLHEMMENEGIHLVNLSLSAIPVGNPDGLDFKAYPNGWE